VAVGGDFEWGGPDIGGRTANLDAAMAEAERRHHGDDDGRHHRALSPHQMVVRMTEFAPLFPEFDEDEP
jgi:hypothetical protein